MRLRASNLSWQRLDDEIVVLDLDGSEYFRLNDSGALLWEALAEGAEREVLVERLVTHYALDTDRAGEDVDAFLTELATNGLLDEA